MDEGLKYMMEQLRLKQAAAAASGQAEEEIPSIEEGAPRPDYSNAVSNKPKFARIAEQIGGLNNEIKVDDAFVAPVPTREVYPSQEKINAQEQAFKSIRGALHGQDFNTIDQIENLKKQLGNK